MSKFTLTPTEFDSQEPSKEPLLKGRIYLCVHIDSGRDDIPCQINGWVHPEVARFIKAGPDLLEALRPFANFACDVPCGCHNCRARAAILKATGEEPQS